MEDSVTDFLFSFLELELKRSSTSLISKDPLNRSEFCSATCTFALWPFHLC